MILIVSVLTMSHYVQSWFIENGIKHGSNMGNLDKHLLLCNLALNPTALICYVFNFDNRWILSQILIMEHSTLRAYINTSMSKLSTRPYWAPTSALHCYPMLTRPKTGSTNQRVIVDLSWVNDRVCNDKYI